MELILGTARGIGQGVCLQFAKAGATIAAFDFRDTAETVELVKKEGVQAKGWQVDATDEKRVKEAIDEVEKELGPIKVLVNVAGITGSRPIMMEYYENFRKTMDTNCGGVRFRGRSD
jgi:NAD(P)-dependent dehydrogenase (short-subunit alcohol dehydrogenase family)